MTKLTSFAAFLLHIICFSFFLCRGLSRPISLKSASFSSDSPDTVIVGDTSSLPTTGKLGEDWFHHWPFAHPPLPADFPKVQWPFVHPPMPAGGFKWPHWPFVHPPMPAGGFKWPHWPFVHPPMPAGNFKWPFVHPPMAQRGKWLFAKSPFPCPPWWPNKGSDNVEIGA